MSTDTKFIVVKIEPCPFCGDADCEVAESHVPNIHGGRQQAVFCHACFSEGPTADSQMDAIIAWNTRPTTQSAALIAALKGLESEFRAEIEKETAWLSFALEVTSEKLFWLQTQHERIAAAIAAAEPKAEGKG